MGQPVFELIKLQTKSAKENIKDEISLCSRHAGRYSSVNIDNMASVLLKKKMQLVVGIDIDVWVFVVALKLATQGQCTRDYPTENPFHDPTHLGKDAFDSSLC